MLAGSPFRYGAISLGRTEFHQGAILQPLVLQIRKPRQQKGKTLPPGPGCISPSLWAHVSEAEQVTGLRPPHRPCVLLGCPSCCVCNFKFCLGGPPDLHKRLAPPHLDQPLLRTRDLGLQSQHQVTQGKAPWFLEFREAGSGVCPCGHREGRQGARPVVLPLQPWHGPSMRFPRTLRSPKTTFCFHLTPEALALTWCTCDSASPRAQPTGMPCPLCYLVSDSHTHW